MTNTTLGADSASEHPCTYQSDHLTRRALFGAMGLAGVVAGLGAAAASTPIAASGIGIPTPFRLAERAYRAAERRFASLPRGLEASDPATYEREEKAYLASVTAVDGAPVADWQEFAEAFRIACDDGDSLPPERLIMKLLRDVQRLSGSAAA